MTASLSKLGLGPWLALASGCALITPLDPVSSTAMPTCRGNDCMDAGKRLDDGSPDAIPVTPGSDAGAQPDAAAVKTSCETIEPGAECDPVRRCGCAANEDCGLDRDSKQVRCLPKSTGTHTAGERCTDTSDCMSALECTFDRICAPYCHDDDDCHGSGECVLATEPNSKQRVPGSGACSRWCDPFTGDPCRADTDCYAAGEHDEDPNATCRYQYASTTIARGEHCEFYNECDARLSCAEFGPRVCTSWCNADADCPSVTPHCYFDFHKKLVAAPNQPIGQCVVWPCTDSALPSPKPWAEGQVFSADQYVTCANRCGPSPACFRANCTDGARWGQCYDQTLEACAGAIGAACRAQYVALTCSDFDGRSPLETAFTNCALGQPACVQMADRTCSDKP
jgi:hypothetical protein